MTDRLPDGKGLWARWPRPTAADLPQLATAGVEYLLVEVLRQHPDPKIRRIEATVDPAFARACKADGVRLLPWAFLDARVPRWSDVAGDTLVASARHLGERWVVLDVEGPVWRAAASNGPMHRLLDRLHAAGLLVAVTSYGTPWTMPGWLACLRCDAALVQLARVGPAAVKALAQWRERYAVVGVVAQPKMAGDKGLAHAKLLGGLVAAMQAAGTTGHLSSWVMDWYSTDARWLELAALEIPGRS